MIKQIKYGLLNKPFITLWKLTMLPLALAAGLVFWLVLVMFNLGFSEANDFMSDLI